MGYFDKMELSQKCPTHGIELEKDAVCEACHAGVPSTVGLPMALFAARNKVRSEASFDRLDALPPEWWTNAMAGEAGEACNVAKKMSRLRMSGLGMAWNKEKDRDMAGLRQRLLRELGDVVIYADLLASREGSTLEECVRLAFNEKSEEIGSDILI